MVQVGHFKKGDLQRIESELNNLWGELNSANIAHRLRMELEEKLIGCETSYRETLAGEESFENLEKELKACDHTLTQAILTQAQQELSKNEKGSTTYLALEDIGNKLNSGELKPVRARHEIKQVMRHHT